MSASKLISYISYALKVVRQRGLKFLLVYFRESVLFDLRHGTSTSARVPKTEQNTTANAAVDKEDGLLYVASFTSVTLRSVDVAIRLLGRERFSDSQFFDLGCGKGKALLVHALRKDIRQNHPSIGIEYDPALAEIARDNLRKCDIPTNKVTVATDSATNFTNYVSAETLVVYIYNSFQGATLRKVLTELAPFPHVLIYVDPAEREVLPQFGYVIHEDVKGSYNADTWLVAARGLTTA